MSIVHREIHRDKVSSVLVTKVPFGTAFLQILAAVAVFMLLLHELSPPDNRCETRHNSRRSLVLIDLQLGCIGGEAKGAREGKNGSGRLHRLRLSRKMAWARGHLACAKYEKHRRTSCEEREKEEGADERPTDARPTRPPLKLPFYWYPYPSPSPVA